MNNAILFFYDLSISEIKRINNNYYFTYLNDNYGVYLYTRGLNELEDIYNLNNDLLNQGLIGFQIILTKDRQMVFNYQNKMYILMRIPNIRNKLITYEDIKSFYFNIDVSKYKSIDKSNWGVNWSNKIDYIYYQFDQVKTKYKVIDSSIDYFIGIWENAISYFNNNKVFKEKNVSHMRLGVDTDLLEFLNPLGFVIDYKERDLGEYIKFYIINRNYSSDTVNYFVNGLDRDSVILLIARLLFPSYYFDVYEEIIIDGLDDSVIEDIICKRDNIISLIKYIFNTYSNSNIPYIEWIKK